MKYAYAHREDSKSAQVGTLSWKAKVLCEISHCSWDVCVRTIDKWTKTFQKICSASNSSGNFQS